MTITCRQSKSDRTLPPPPSPHRFLFSVSSDVDSNSTPQTLNCVRRCAAVRSCSSERRLNRRTVDCSHLHGLPHAGRLPPGVPLSPSSSAAAACRARRSRSAETVKQSTRQWRRHVTHVFLAAHSRSRLLLRGPVTLRVDC